MKEMARKMDSKAKVVIEYLTQTRSQVVPAQTIKWPYTSNIITTCKDIPLKHRGDPPTLKLLIYTQEDRPIHLPWPSRSS
jgi:hypothetical protein